jgi:hypothetical protein
MLLGVLMLAFAVVLVGCGGQPDTGRSDMAVKGSAPNEKGKAGGTIEASLVDPNAKKK